MNRSTRRCIAGLTASAVVAALLGLVVTVATAQEEPVDSSSTTVTDSPGDAWVETAVMSAPQTTPASDIAAALQATRAARRVHFTGAVTIGDVRISTLGEADVVDGRTAVTLSAGTARTELRRLGTDLYINARSLGSGGQQWVMMRSSTTTRQMSARSVASLVETLSPKRTLDAIDSASEVLRVGTDAYGTHYRVRSDESKVVAIPLAEAFGRAPSGAGLEWWIDVWVDAQGRVGRVATTMDGFASRISLRGFGTPIHVQAPPASATGSVSSQSGRYLFGSGMDLPTPGPTAPAVRVAPTVELVDGVIRGNLHATSATGQSLGFTVESSTRRGKLRMGTVITGNAAVDSQSFTTLPYANWIDGAAKGTEIFAVRARESTRVDRYEASIPLIGTIASASIALLQVMPAVGRAYAPVIGATRLAQIPVNVGDLAPGDTPVAFTYQVRGYRGTRISTNFFPASGLASGQTANTVLQGSALGQPGNTDPYQVFDAASSSVSTAALRGPRVMGPNYNVITWDPRGEFASGGVNQLDNPFFEGRDVSEIITWAAQSTPATLNGSLDPSIAIVGGSSGGAAALVTASIDPRVDAIVPAATWNSLVDSLQTNGVLNVSAARDLLDTLTSTGTRANPQLVSSLSDSIAKGRLTADALTILADDDVSTLLLQLQAPALLWQSEDDSLFPLGQSLDTAERILSNPYGTPVKIAWIDSSSPKQAVRDMIDDYTLMWIDKYIAGLQIPDAAIPTFQWWDQTGTRFTSDMYPFSAGFNLPTPISATSAGGRLRLSAPGASPVSRIAVPVSVPIGSQIVGAPAITFAYRGTGTARAIPVRIVDAATGKSLGPQDNLVPVVLDGKRHTVSVPLGDIAFTAQGSATLTVLLRGSTRAVPSTVTGEVNIMDLQVDFPSRDNG